DPRGPSGRPRGADGRGPRDGWQAPSGPRRLHRRTWTPVRLLHAWNDDVLRRAAPEKSTPHGGTDPPRNLREPVPVHRVREYREGDPARREQDGRTFGRRTTMTVHGGIGQSVKRKEDARFVRGKGTYVDDVKLPGMLYLDIVRSPYAHARIRYINIEKALKVPRVLAVIRGKDLEAANLAWMPTLMSDKQMVLPVERVMYQSQEVAAVVADSRYAAADGVAAVEVEYEPLPVVVDPKKALEPDAPILRPDRKGQTNRIWHWEVGDRAGTEKALKESDVVVHEVLYLPRIHVSSIETCGCVASFDAMGKLTVWMTTQAPHAIRTVFALVADHGYTDAAANPSKFPAGLFHIVTGSYPFEKAHVEVDGVYTNKPPGGIAYRCSFRVTEAAFTIERIVDSLARKLGMDPAEFRMKNFIPPEAFPFKSALGWEYDSGNYGAALQKAMDIVDYDALRKEQEEKRERGELMGIGISSFTEIVGAGPSHTFDILGLKMFDSCEIRIHPTGKAIARFGTKSQGQGH